MSEVIPLRGIHMHEAGPDAAEIMECAAKVISLWRKGVEIEPRVFRYLMVENGSGHVGAAKSILRKIKVDLEYIERSLK